MGAIGGGGLRGGIGAGGGEAHLAHGPRVQGPEGEGGVDTGLEHRGSRHSTQWGPVCFHAVLHVTRTACNPYCILTVLPTNP